MSTETKSLAALDQALQDEFKKGDKASIETIQKLTAQISAKAQETQALKEENAQLKSKADDPNGARIRQINNGKTLTLKDTFTDANGKEQDVLVEIEFTLAAFKFPRVGRIVVTDVMARPEKYANVVARLYARKANVIRVVSVKKGGN